MGQNQNRQYANYNQMLGQYGQQYGAYTPTQAGAYGQGYPQSPQFVPTQQSNAVQASYPQTQQSYYPSY